MSENTRFKIEKMGKKSISERGYKLETSVDGDFEPDRKHFTRLMERHDTEHVGHLLIRRIPFTK